VAVTFNPKSMKVKFDLSDPSLHLSTVAEQEHEDFAATLDAGPGAPTLPAAGPAPGSASAEVTAALAEVSAATAGTDAASREVLDTLAAIKQARATGDLDEVARLKAEFARRSAADQESPAEPGAGAGSGTGSDDPLERLQKLGDLRDRGILTEAEFAAEKAKILGEG
jgi:Short C-terminal domain